MRLRLKYLPNILRLAAFVLTVGVVLAVFSARAAASRTREGMLSFGRQMLEYADRTALGETRTLAINGVNLDFAVGSTADPVETVLNYYADRCAARGTTARAPSDVQGQLPPESTVPVDSSRVSTRQRGWVTSRQSNEARGYVACLDTGNVELTSAEILRRVQAFVAGGDLSEVGRLRYLYAERASHDRTRFVGFWSDGPVRLLAMFPSHGDAPGIDVSDVPRPAGMRRILSAREVNQPYLLAMYAGNQPRSVLESHFASSMPAAGYTLLPPRGGHADPAAERMLTYERGNRTVTIVLGESGGASSATVLAAH